MFSYIDSFFDTNNNKQESIEYPDVSQGVSYLDRIGKMCSSLQNNMELIENFTASKKDGDIWRSGLISNDTIEQEQKKELEELKDLETKFQQKLTQYSGVYKNYSEELQKALQDGSNKYNNKTIMTPDGSGYYVNKFGIARFWSGDAWDKRAKGCPSVTKILTNDITSLGLTLGEPMDIGEPCGHEGTNVQMGKTTASAEYLGCYADNGKVVGLDKGIGDNLELQDCVDQAAKMGFKYIGYHGAACYGSNSYPNEGEDEKKCPTQGDHRIGSYIYNAIYQLKDDTTKTNNIAYVDETNTLREYPNGNTENNTGSCPSSITGVTSEVWSAFRRGMPMDINSLCSLGKVDIKDKKELIQINKELMDIAHQIYDKILSAKEKFKTYNHQSRVEEDYLNKQLKNYEHLFKKMEHIDDTDITLHAMFNDARLNTTSSNVHFIIWTLLASFLIIMAIKYIRK